MNLYGIEVSPRRMPELDPDFIPLYQFNQAFLKDAKKPLSLAVERADGRWLCAIPLSMAPGT